MSHLLHTDWCCVPEMALAICAARVCSKRIDFTLLELETKFNLIEKGHFLGELHLIVLKGTVLYMSCSPCAQTNASPKKT